MASDDAEALPSMDGDCSGHDESTIQLRAGASSHAGITSTTSFMGTRTMHNGSLITASPVDSVELSGDGTVGIDSVGLPTTIANHGAARAARVPFATKWLPNLFFGPALFIGGLLLQFALANVVSSELLQAYRLPILHGAAGIYFALIFLAQQKLFYPDLRFRGDVASRDMLMGIGAVSFLYAACFAIDWVLAIPREPYMVTLGDGLSPLQLVVLYVSLFILPPIVEELGFRHILLSALPFRAGRWTAWAAILVSALAFMGAHSYVNWTTQALMLLLGVTFAVARIYTQGLLLPMLLHAYAVGMALTFNYLEQTLGR